ncbi:MAG: NAD+ synthase [Rhodoferax sp.]
MSLTVCIAQINPMVGDLAGNCRKIAAFSRAAYAQGARLVLTPELSVCGYPAEDLLLRPAFVQACEQAVTALAQSLADLPDLSVVVGHPLGGEQRTRSVTVPQRYNTASVLCGGRVVARYAKRELPNYQVFDERRYFAAGDSVCVFEAGASDARFRVGLLICEDAWFAAPARQCRDAGAELLVVINASPFHIGKGAEREQAMRERVLDCGLPLIYAHGVGGQDEVVFEGGSFALNARGELAARAPSFEEISLLAHVESAQGATKIVSTIAPLRDPDAQLWDALVLGLRDYVEKNGFPSVVLGLSGGIDSALVLALAVDALGPQRVRALMMPSPYTADISWLDAREMAQRLGVRYDELSIVAVLDAFKATLASQFVGLPEDTTEENLQARIRGTLLMALSNKFGSLVLTTGNKSEMATGYCTLYGDMAGGFAVIKDLVKTTVFRLARWRNAHDPYGRGSNPIPERIITRPPSAELRPDQTDQDSLPPYEVLDAIIQRYMENDMDPADIVADGFEPDTVAKVVRLIHINEYKRRQAPVGLRVTHRGFGKDWRYPISNRYRGERPLGTLM